MGLLYTKITNPLNVGCSYSWFPGGIHLRPGESRTVNFDPFTSVMVKKKHLKALMLQDLNSGRVKFEYWAEEPATCILPEEPAKRATRQHPPAPPVEEGFRADAPKREEKPDTSPEPQKAEDAQADEDDGVFRLSPPPRAARPAREEDDDPFTISTPGGARTTAVEVGADSEEEVVPVAAPKAKTTKRSSSKKKK